MTYIELLPEQLHAIFEVATGEKIKNIEYTVKQTIEVKPELLGTPNGVSFLSMEIQKVKLIIDKGHIKAENNRKETDKCEKD